jgi:sulfite exporter TauE/SafE
MPRQAGTRLEFIRAMNLMNGPALAAVGSLGAWIAGAAGSPHCALMCGPLACGGCAAGCARERRRAALAWQIGRGSAYAGLGAVLGSVGKTAAALLAGSVARALPWVMAGGLLLSALDWGGSAPAIPGLARIPRVLLRAGEKFSPFARSFLRGAACGFLPCGLLYGALLMAAAAGGPVGGALVMSAFALGGVPALALAQAQAGRLARNPRARVWLRRGLPVLAAVALVWRAVATGGGHSCH